MKRIFWGVILLLVIGLGNAEAAPPRSKSPSQLVQAVPLCIISEDTAGFHLIVTSHFSHTDKNGGKGGSVDRSLWQVMCRKNSGCYGVHLDLDRTDQGKGISLLDLGIMEGVRLISKTHKVAIFRWGPLRTFTLDMATKTLTYTESANADQLIFFSESEGRGVANCP